MRITSFSSSHAQMGGTRTYEDFHKWLGEKPERLGIVSNLYKQYTASALTEALMNVYTRDKAKSNSFQSINSFLVEWDIDVNFVKRLPILAIDGDGVDGSEVIFHFPERYYEMYDVFVIEDTRQQAIVKTVPVRRSDACYEVVCQLIDNDYSESVDDSVVGMQTRFLTNHMPELHETGYSKYQSNIEKHRTYIGTHRCDIDMSAKYAAMEDQFIKIATDDKKEFTYKMTGAEKACLDSYMLVRNNKLLFSKGSVDANGKTTLHDELGRPLLATEGIIPQIERFATKFVFNKLNVRMFEQAMDEMIAKCDNPQGNVFTFIVNTKMNTMVQRVMAAWLRDWKTDGGFIWSKGTNGYVKVGTTFDSYTYNGNTIVFKLDRSLDLEFPNKAFGMFIDLTTDGNGRAGLQMFTFKNGQLIHNYITGVGGRNGMSSGEVSSPVAGSKVINWGYAGVGVMNPYRSAILEEI